jgi:CheY-like chemotaxis protein/HPt (histidine-containing phosphotransfer) domain-containing protein
LLSNAIKFTPKQGGIELRVGTATATGLEHRIRFEVADTGIGIAPEHHQQIFESFTQLDASNTRKHGGTGLGLSIASQLVSMMGGHLQVQSDLGLGSRFSFDIYLPVSSDDPAADNTYPSQTMPMEFEQLNAHANRFSGLNVLLAEDHHVNEILMSQMLLVFGCSIAIAHNGLEAVAAWRRGGIDLILMDVQMPELNGLDATMEIRNLEAGRQHHTPIVAVTANAMAGDREQCLAAGMDDYVPKPVNPAVLIQAMANALKISQGQDGDRSGTSIVRPPTKTVVIAPTRVQPDAPAPDKVAITPTRTPLNQGPALDLDKLRHRMGNDAQALSQLAAAMRNDMSIHLKGLEEAFENEDRSSACMHAHSLKGSLASMTAQKAANLSNGLELAAKTAEWSLFSRSLPLLKLEIQKIDEVLQTLL